jgi:hypothetical protein
MKLCPVLVLAFSLCLASAAFVSAQTPPAGRVAARPLYRDPVFDHPMDPVVVFNAESKRWLMYYI